VTVTFYTRMDSVSRAQLVVPGTSRLGPRPHAGGRASEDNPPCPSGLRFLPDVVSGHSGFSSVGTKNAAEHSEGGRFSGGVRSNQAEDLSGLHLQIQISDGHQWTEGLGQVGR